MRLHTRVQLPVADPDVPEVIVFEGTERETRVPAPGQGFWFMVPEDAEKFWIECRRSGVGSAPVNRVSLWNPDGERAYNLSYTGAPPGRLTIDVPPEHAGKLWHATGGPYHIDSRIPPYFSVSRWKWFDPEE